jgi:hypothetical protein
MLNNFDSDLLFSLVEHLCPEGIGLACVTCFVGYFVSAEWQESDKISISSML